MNHRVLITLALLSLFFAGCRKGEQKSQATPTPTSAPPPTIQWASAVERTVPTVVSLTGSLSVDEPIEVSPQTSARVERVLVEVGDTVVVGQPLFTLSETDTRLQILEDQASLTEAYAQLGLRPGEKLKDKSDVPAVRKALAILKNAEENYNQYKSLRKQELISDQQLSDQKKTYQTAKADYESALEQVDQNLASIAIQKAKVAQDKQQLAYTSVHSPVSGGVEKVSVSPGSVARVGTTAVTILETEQLYLELAVPQELVLDVKPGKVIKARATTVPPIEFQARVEQIDPSLDTATRTLKVKAGVIGPTGELKPGMFAQVDFDTGRSTTSLLVPQSGVLTQAGISQIFLVEEQAGHPVVKQHSVKLKDTVENWVEVSGDLNPGDRVAASNLAALKDGKRVELGKEISAPVLTR